MKISETIVGKLLVFAFLFMFLAPLSSCAKASPEVQQQVQRIQQKAKMAQSGVKQKHRSGEDVSELLKLMAQVKPNIDNRQFAKAEAILDEVLKSLETGEPPSSSEPRDPQSISYDFSKPQRVTIKGYSDDAMEPFISRDARYLFFNNLNDPHVVTNLHYAERIDDLTYAYKGEVKGVNTKSLEGVPTMDERNQFCFVSTRDFAKTKLTLFCGDFSNGKVTGLHNIDQTLEKRKGLWLNMGPELSPDGKTLYYVESNLDKNTGIPKALNISIAEYRNGAYYKLKNSDELMKNINTKQLEYAPGISRDGLTLYFTRASELIVGNQSAGKDLRIFISTRSSLDEPFGKPKKIDVIRGFVEGPTLLENGRVMYFHKKDGRRFYIYRVVKNN